MRIDNLRSELQDGVAKFEATATWEDTHREPADVYFAVLERDAGRVSLNADAFRIPAAVVARHDREARIGGGGEICPSLRNGLADAIAWLTRWSGVPGPAPELDFPLGCSHPVAGQSGAAASFVSGGVDSTAAIVANHEAFSSGHPMRVSVGIVVVGIQSSRWTAWEGTRDRLEAAHRDLSWLAAETGIDVVPVATNLRTLNRGGTFWKYEYQGAALAGVGHLFATSVSHLSIASTWEIPNLDNWGSHPVLDTSYGSHSLRVWHELASIGRLEKTRLISTRPGLFAALNVCNKAEAGDLNCGRCEKCLRTMLAVLALGSPTGTPQFVNADLDTRDLKQIRILDPGLEGEYAELLAPLRERGYEEFAKIVEFKIRQGRLLQADLPARVRRLGARVIPRNFREQYLGVRKIPR